MAKFDTASPKPSGAYLQLVDLVYHQSKLGDCGDMAFVSSDKDWMLNAVVDCMKAASEESPE